MRPPPLDTPPPRNAGGPSEPPSPSKSPVKQLSRKTWKRIATSLRILSMIQMVSGIGIIVLAILLQWPPNDALTV